MDYLFNALDMFIANSHNGHPHQILGKKHTVRIKELCNEINSLSTEIAEEAQQITALSNTIIAQEWALQALNDEQTANRELRTSKQKELAALGHSYHEAQLRLATKKQQLAKTQAEFILETERVIAVIGSLNETIAQLIQAKLPSLPENVPIAQSLNQPNLMQKTLDEQLSEQEQQVKRLAERVARIEGQSAEQTARKESRFFTEFNGSSTDTANLAPINKSEYK